MFMEEKSQMDGEFQAIILSGYGNSLYPLTLESNVPKGLLPIQNKPLIYHSLQWVEKTSITNVLIAVYPDAKQKITSFTEQYETNLKVTVHEVKEGCGSADALRQLRPFIKNDFIVISCDMISDVSPHLLINTHRAQNNTMTCLLYDATMLEPQEKINKEDGEVIALHEDTSQLLMMVSMGDLKSADQIHIRDSMLARFPNVKLCSKLRDSHLYIFKRWVLELLVKNQQLSSVKYDLVPLLLESQYRKAVAKREGFEELQAEYPPDLFEKARLLSIGSDNKSTAVTCTALITRKGFTARANTVWSYSEINRSMCRIHPQQIPTSSIVDPKTQIGSDSMIGEGVSILERCSVKRSVIGNHVKIGKNCKISNSIVMDYVVIEDGVKIDSCVICHAAKISAKAELKDCEVGGKYVVPVDTKSKGEQFVASNL